MLTLSELLSNDVPPRRRATRTLLTVAVALSGAVLVTFGAITHEFLLIYVGIHLTMIAFCIQVTAGRFRRSATEHEPAAPHDTRPRGGSSPSGSSIFGSASSWSWAGLAGRRRAV